MIAISIKNCSISRRGQTNASELRSMTAEKPKNLRPFLRMKMKEKHTASQAYVPQGRGLAFSAVLVCLRTLGDRRPCRVHFLFP